MGKREARERVLNAVAVWSDVWDAFKDLAPADPRYGKAQAALLRSSDELFTAYRDTLPKDVGLHPGFDYYDIDLDGTKVPACRCRTCGLEVSPRGVQRHHQSPACGRERARRIGKSPPSAQD